MRSLTEVNRHSDELSTDRVDKERIRACAVEQTHIAVAEKLVRSRMIAEP